MSTKHQWLVRPSSVGDLMTGGRKKDELWGETALTVIQEAALFHKYGIEPGEIINAKIEKGNINERQNIEMASRVLGWIDVDPDAPKIRLVNDFIIGEPDVNSSILADIKTSWSANTFPWFKNPQNKSYFFQMQCYMWLTGKQQAELVYCLSNHPPHIIAAEVKRLTYYYADRPFLFQDANSIDELWTLAERKAESVVMKEAIVDHIPEERRVKRFIIERDEEAIQSIQERITQARELFDKYMNEI
jgi:hypothetical protein